MAIEINSNTPIEVEVTSGLQQKQSDWSQTDTTKVDYIKNKPSIPSKTSELTNDSGFITSAYHDSTKQDTLVSGTNIKTVNSSSLLGSGNIEIAGSFTATYNVTPFEDIWNAYQAGKVCIAVNGDYVYALQNIFKSTESLGEAGGAVFSAFYQNRVQYVSANYVSWAPTTTTWTTSYTDYQRALTAGNNVQINGTTISATDTTYTAGTNIGINNNEISFTGSIPTKTSDLTNDSGFITNSYHDSTKQDKLTAGTNITIDANNVISAAGSSYTAGDDIKITNNEISTIYGGGKTTSYQYVYNNKEITGWISWSESITCDNVECLDVPSFTANIPYTLSISLTVNGEVKSLTGTYTANTGYLSQNRLHFDSLNDSYFREIQFENYQYTPSFNIHLWGNDTIPVEQVTAWSISLAYTGTSYEPIEANYIPVDNDTVLIDSDGELCSKMTYVSSSSSDLVISNSSSTYLWNFGISTIYGGAKTDNNPIITSNETSGWDNWTKIGDTWYITAFPCSSVPPDFSVDREYSIIVWEGTGGAGNNLHPTSYSSSYIEFDNINFRDITYMKFSGYNPLLNTISIAVKSDIDLSTSPRRIDLKYFAGYVYTTIDSGFIPVSGTNDGTNWETITIGDTTKNIEKVNGIYWATYGTTTHTQIVNAITAGKTVMLKYSIDGSLTKYGYFILDQSDSSTSTTNKYRFRCVIDNKIYGVQISDLDTWSELSTYYLSPVEIPTPPNTSYTYVLKSTNQALSWVQES